MEEVFVSDQISEIIQNISTFTDEQLDYLLVQIKAMANITKMKHGLFNKNLDDYIVEKINDNLFLRGYIESTDITKLYNLFYIAVNSNSLSRDLKISLIVKILQFSTNSSIEQSYSTNKLILEQSEILEILDSKLEQEISQEIKDNISDKQWVINYIKTITDKNKSELYKKDINELSYFLFHYFSDPDICYYITSYLGDDINSFRVS